MDKPINFTLVFEVFQYNFFAIILAKDVSTGAEISILLRSNKMLNEMFFFNGKDGRSRSGG